MINILMNSMTLDKRWCRLELRDYIKPGSRVTIIGFQFYEEELRSEEHWSEFYDKKTGAFYRYIVDQFAFFDVGAKSIKWINYFRDTPSSALRKVKNSDVLIFTDGIAERMLEIIGRLELSEAISKYKGVIVGFGAGAVIQLSDYLYGSAGSECMRGLGLIDNIGLEIHAEECDIMSDSVRKFIREKKKPLYAIAEEGAVIVDGSDVSTIGDVYVINSPEDLENLEGLDL